MTEKKIVLFFFVPTVLLWVVMLWCIWCVWHKLDCCQSNTKHLAQLAILLALPKSAFMLPVATSWCPH